jgi:hypothetical protein
LTDSYDKTIDGTITIGRTTKITQKPNPMNTNPFSDDFNKPGGSLAQKTVNFDLMNDYIGNCLSDVVRFKSDGISEDFNDLLQENLSFPGCKFLELFGESRSTAQKINPEQKSVMKKIMGSLGEQIAGNNVTDFGDGESFTNRVLSCSAMYKGFDDGSGGSKLEDGIIKYFSGHCKPIEMFSGGQGIDGWLKLKKIGGDKEKVEKLMVLTNRTGIGKCVGNIAAIAKEKYKYKAYVHWYQKFGVYEDMFEEAFESCWSIVDNYSYVN